MEFTAAILILSTIASTELNVFVNGFYKIEENTNNNTVITFEILGLDCRIE